MTEFDDPWRRALSPPAGGLARLQRSVASRNVRSARHWPSPLALIPITLVAALALGVASYVRHAPQRAFEHTLHAAIAAMPAADVVVEHGVARDLPSSRPDVRIIVLAAPMRAPTRP